LIGDFLGKILSWRMDEASKALKDVPKRFLDALVDSTFKFTDQPLDPSEVLSVLHSGIRTDLLSPFLLLRNKTHRILMLLLQK